MNSITTSYGIILLNETLDEILLIQRKHSIEFIDIILGRYPDENGDALVLFCQNITHDEKNKLLHENFNTLWDSLWNTPERPYYNYFLIARKKFLKIDFKQIFTFVKTVYETPEYTLPKGRCQPGEPNFDCALREFYEETGISTNTINVHKDKGTFEETFIGTNGIVYSTTYFLATLKNIHHLKPKINNEVQKIGFYTFEDCLRLLRPYRTATRSLIRQIKDETVNGTIPK
jgi:ADP-ribose pyrophosphatase YjhB (NUDIX family)